MKQSIKRVMALLATGVLTLGLLAPVTRISAADKNKAAEIPVNFTNSSWEDDWDSTSRTEANFWNLAEPSSYSDSYTVSYKLYIPVSFMKEDSAISLGGSLGFSDATEDEWKFAGYAEIPTAELHPDASFTTWDEENEKDVPIDYAEVKKTGDFYVITYKNTAGSLHTEDAQSDVSKAEKVAVDFNISIKGINIAAKNSAIYLDDLKIEKADGTVLTDKNFTSDKNIEGGCLVAPKTNWETDTAPIKLATLTDNQVLTVGSSKLNVKTGKTAKISAAATPASKITYTSSNKKIATVNAKGVVTGRKAGKTTISVKANGKTIKVTVTVK